MTSELTGKTCRIFNGFEEIYREGVTLIAEA
jgi:hypothetical protein